MGMAATLTAVWRGATAAVATPNPRILVVDGNEIVLSVLDEFLSHGYQVDTASDAATALAAAAKRPDMILLDVNLAGLDGLALLAALRARGITTPVFVMTGYDKPGGAERAKLCGATQYLVKPVDLRRLDSLIARELNSSPILPS